MPNRPYEKARFIEVISFGTVEMEDLPDPLDQEREKRLHIGDDPQIGKPEDPGSSGRSDARPHKGGFEKLIDDFNDHIDMVNSQKKKTHIRSAVGYFIASCGAVYTAVQIAVTVSTQ